MHCLGGRVLKPEILDTLPPEDARASLADLPRINARWGGYSALRRLFAEVVEPGAEFSLLDVGAASGDMGRKIREWYPGARVVSLDRIATHLETAADPRVAGDAFVLPFADHSFDFVFSSLFLHHFTNEEIVRLFGESARVARKAVLAIDLLRNPLAYYFLPTTQWLFGWNWVTVNDGPISVEAAFQPRELQELAERAGLKDVRVRAYFKAFRVAMVGKP